MKKKNQKKFTKCEYFTLQPETAFPSLERVLSVKDILFFDFLFGVFAKWSSDWLLINEPFLFLVDTGSPSIISYLGVIKENFYLNHFFFLAKFSLLY